MIQYRILFKRNLCVQCGGCETACSAWRNPEPGVKYRRISAVWKESYPDTAPTPVSHACMHCKAPDCLKACTAGAITESNGIVSVDREICTGCRACLKACPVDAPQFGADGKMQKCNLCIGLFNPKTDAPPCVKTCPTGALELKIVNQRGLKI